TGEIRVQVQEESVWLSQRQMAEVFDTSTDNISLHLKNIFAEGEMKEESTTEDFSVVRQEGQRRVRRRVRHYNLDGILAVGYRVSSGRAIQFRKWATQILREHLTRGYTINRQRFEDNARELEAALQLVRKASAAPALDAQW
ncbi:MAG: virulence RhuM family protein, partial [Desulfovermiculus sp.]|nr:virulence RhuM family protein [Desulfovermiculus sp.]